MLNKKIACAFFAPLLAATPSVSLATPSGLNNIPTADTTPQGTVVIQGFSTLGGSDRDDDFNLGFKSGLDLGKLTAEFGADSRLFPHEAGPVTFQAKLALPLGEGLPALAAGLANTTFSSADANRAGENLGYLVATQDLVFVRAHAGCGLQDGDLLPFVGFDKTLTTSSFGLGSSTSGKSGAAQERDLMTLRADAIQQHDSTFLYSAGVLIPLSKFVVLETWGNLPSNGDDPSLTLKINFVLNF